MIVLVHGLGVGERYFRPLAAQLGPGVLVPELREPLPIPELAARLAAAFEGPATLVAHSMGCQVAAELAVTRPELVEALVLLGPTVDRHERGWARHLARFAVDSWYEPPSLTAVAVADYVSMGPLAALRQAQHALAHRIETVLPRVEQEAVVVRGAHDPLCPEAWAREAAALLPRGRLVTVAGAAHAVHFSHPCEVADVVRRVRAGTPAAAG